MFYISFFSNVQCEYLTVWPQQGQHACNEAAEHQVVKKGRGASYESPPPALPPRQPRNNPANTSITATQSGSFLIKFNPKFHKTGVNIST